MLRNILALPNDAAIDNLTKRMKALRPGTYEYKLSRVYDTNTQRQRGYLRGCVYPHVAAGFLEKWGENFDDEEIDLMMKRLFWCRIIRNKKTDREIARIPRSLSKATTVEMNDYIEKVRHFAAEHLGVVVPDPDTNFRAAAETRKPRRSNSRDAETSATPSLAGVAA